MPPFRDSIELIDRRLGPEAMYHLRKVGHGRVIAVVDASYDIPEGAIRIPYGGTTAQALIGIGTLIPIEENKVTYMEPDLDIDLLDDPEAAIASEEISKALDELSKVVDEKLILESLYRRNEDEVEDPLEDGGDPQLGFYDTVNDPKNGTVYIQTLDPNKFACLYVLAGHSQDGIPL